jgi:hypothetical protein
MMGRVKRTGVRPAALLAGSLVPAKAVTLWLLLGGDYIDWDEPKEIMSVFFVDTILYLAPTLLVLSAAALLAVRTKHTGILSIVAATLIVTIAVTSIVFTVSPEYILVQFVEQTAIAIALVIGMRRSGRDLHG